jgi:hypothetical protein
MSRSSVPHDHSTIPVEKNRFVLIQKQREREKERKRARARARERIGVSKKYKVGHVKFRRY